MPTRDYSERIRQLSFKLNSLLDISLALSQNLPVDQLIEHYKRILKDDLGIGKILLLLNSGEWTVLLNEGYEEERVKNLNPNKNLNDISDITFLPAQISNTLGSVDIVLPVLHNGKPFAYALVGDINEDSTGISPVIKHLPFAHILTRVVVMTIENQRLFQESLQQEATRKELELAKRMQSMLVPSSSSLPYNENYAFQAFYLPHLSVGGDYYDVIPFSPTSVGFCIADVSGKGVPAALLMANFQANLRATFSAEINLCRLVELLNERVFSNANGENFITFFAGRYNARTKQFEYINAGHNIPYLINHETGEITELTIGCPGIGMIDDLVVSNFGKISITAPSHILCYTDGLVEQNKGNEVLNLEYEVRDIVKKSQTGKKAIETTLDQLQIKPENPALFDDVTLLSVDFY